MILVTGATGSTGGALLAQLGAAGVAVRAGTRDTRSERAEALEGDGFEVVACGFGEAQQLREALAGVEAVFLASAQHPEQAKLQNALVDAAKEAGARSIVKLSGGTAITSADSPSWVGRAHWETEEHIRASGLEHTFLRPNWFMKNLLALADPIRSGALPVPVGDRPTALVDHRDVAAVAATVLTADTSHDGQAYDLTGPESISFSELADRLSRALGREVAYVDPPVDAAVEALRAKGAPDWLLDHMRQIWGAISAGEYADATGTVEAVTGRPPRPVDEFIRDHRGELE